MKSKKNKKSDARLDLIDAAIWLMRERNSLEFTLVDVSQKASANSALVKYYFGNKEGLLFAVLENIFADAAKRTVNVKNLPLDPEKRLRMHLKGLVNSYYKTPFLHSLLHKMMREGGQARIKNFTNEYLLPISEAQGDILKEGKKAGIFRDIDETLFYFQAAGAAMCLYQNRFLLQNAYGVKKITPKLHEQNVDQTVEMLLSGILA